LCNIHHLRGLKALKEIEKEDWARNMYRLLESGRREKEYSKKECQEIKSSYVSRINETHLLQLGVIVVEVELRCVRTTRSTSLCLVILYFSVSWRCSIWKSE